MHGGIDIGTETVVVATPDGTGRHRNAVRAVDDTDEVEGSALTVRTENGVYAVGNRAAPTSADDTVSSDEDVTRLFGEAGGHGPAGAALEALFDATDNRPPDERSLGEDLYGYVDRGSTSRELSRLSTDRPFDLVSVDPGMAVCYDVLDTPPEGGRRRAGERAGVRDARARRCAGRNGDSSLPGPVVRCHRRRRGCRRRRRACCVEPRAVPGAARGYRGGTRRARPGAVGGGGGRTRRRGGTDGAVGG
ncbi:MAG: hypothetical protein J07HX64_00132 [halophilic archaeon J07HX64]|nr:MAG: hypothetical protein J07HX64_00132 [halophilic archaeon J07HX64]